MTLAIACASVWGELRLIREGGVAVCRLISSLVSGSTVGLGRYRLACRHFRLRRRFSGGGFLFLIVKEQENQGQAAYDQEADDEGGDGGCVFH